VMWSSRDDEDHSAIQAAKVLVEAAYVKCF
jgi:hypothetical protein